MCGVIGIAGKTPVIDRLYEGLSLLQHRGQDAAGIATLHNGKLCRRKSTGLVRDVFRQKHIDTLKGNMGIGHCRYPTAGTDSVSEAQPFYVNAPFGIVMAHNGNLVNSDQLHREMYETNLRHINTSSDSEVLLNVFAHELQDQVDSIVLAPEQVFAAMDQVMERCEGGYAVVSMILGRGLVAFRDPNGIRPLILGKRETPFGTEWAVASESVALVGNDFEIERDVSPGETIYIDCDGVMHSHVWRWAFTEPKPCIFEYVYLARPDSVMDGISVYNSRMRLGAKLAATIAGQIDVEDIDVIIPIPDTGRTIALDVAAHLKVQYREGFIKNRYIGRTFIMPGQQERIDSVRKKLSPIEREFKDLNVLLVDDSIVRGTTSQQIVQMVRHAGAKKVFFASAAPPVMFPNVYGIDMASSSELIAHGRTIEQMRQIIGCDKLIFQRIQDMIDAVSEGNPLIRQYETGCFSGEYITGGVDDAYIASIQRRRESS